MRFTLTYDGPLPSKGDPADKAAIRKHFHPQLERLWTEHPILQEVFANRYYPIGTLVQRYEAHHVENFTSTQPTSLEASTKNLCEPVAPRGADKKTKARFLPLVRESLALKCALRILFLRPAPPGGVLDNGDIDNRLKTLFDALSVPDRSQEKSAPTEGDEPIYTLLENDRDVISLEVDTRQLFTHPEATDEFARLIIDVETRITHARGYNQPFLGG